MTILLRQARKTRRLIGQGFSRGGNVVGIRAAARTKAVAIMAGSTLLVVATMIAPAGAAAGASRTYTIDANFEEGTANNVVHTPSDQLQLDDTTTAFPFIWIALSARGTIAKIDTAT